jgi:predicted XRE-type DNA-binding protein
LKANIVIEIDETIGKRGLTHVGAARLLGMPVAELTELLRGRTRPYTVDRLQELLRRLSA